MTAEMLVSPYATSEWDCLTTSTRESHLGEECSKFICETYFNSKGNFLISNDTLGLGNVKAVLAAELGLGLNRAPERDTSCQPGPRHGLRNPRTLFWNGVGVTQPVGPQHASEQTESSSPPRPLLSQAGLGTQGLIGSEAYSFIQRVLRTPRVRPRKTCFLPLWSLQLTGNQVITQILD